MRFFGLKLRSESSFGGKFQIFFTKTGMCIKRLCKLWNDRESILGSWNAPCNANKRTQSILRKKILNQWQSILTEKINLQNFLPFFFFLNELLAICETLPSLFQSFVRGTFFFSRSLEKSNFLKSTTLCFRSIFLSCLCQFWDLFHVKRWKRLDFSWNAEVWL